MAEIVAYFPTVAGSSLNARISNTDFGNKQVQTNTKRIRVKPEKPYT